MRSLAKRRIGTWVTGLLCAIFLAGPVHPQHSEGLTLEVTTQERLESEPWWPTMSNAPLAAYAGSEACVKCHAEGARPSAMQHAAQRANDARFLAGAGSASVVQAPLHYKLQSSPQGLTYSVARGDDTLSRKLAWVIGAGDLGRTFLYQEDGRWMQSETSFYTRPAALDITTGLGRSSGKDLAAALGQPLTGQDARACFGCHTVHATTSAGLEPLHAEPGLGCEACHGPAREHVNRMAHQIDQTDQTVRPAGAPRTSVTFSDAVFDPSKLTPQDSIDFCGSCHRTSADAKLSTTQAFGLSVVRFQPYRLEESRCWRATKDQRLTCVACHNPHQPLERSSFAYDKQCLQCHAGSASTPAPAHTALVCPRAKSNCVSCHMPKVAVASMHGEFTDHYIRVVRPGELMPQ